VILEKADEMLQEVPAAGRQADSFQRTNTIGCCEQARVRKGVSRHCRAVSLAARSRNMMKFTAEKPSQPRFRAFCQPTRRSWVRHVVVADASWSDVSLTVQ